MPLQLGGELPLVADQKHADPELTNCSSRAGDGGLRRVVSPHGIKCNRPQVSGHSAQLAATGLCAAPAMYVRLDLDHRFAVVIAARGTCAV